MRNIIDSFKFTDHGRDFTAEIMPDEGHDAPWENEDGHGPVSKWQHGGNWSRPHTSPGDRVLCNDRGSIRVYDMQEATRLAWKDGWGLSDADVVELSTRLKRPATRGDIVHAAVERDFQRLRAWCADEWCYVTVHVIDDETGDDDYLGGVESDGDYWKECAREMASGLHPLADVAEAAELGGHHD